MNTSSEEHNKKSKSEKEYFKRSTSKGVLQKEYFKRSTSKGVLQKRTCLVKGQINMYLSIKSK
jgi:hypothetical protein